MDGKPVFYVKSIFEILRFCDYHILYLTMYYNPKLKFDLASNELGQCYHYFHFIFQNALTFYRKWP